MENRLSAAVGDPKCKSPKPGNKPKDIATVEIWLIAQGASYNIKGKVTPELVKWIKIYQGSKGRVKEPNGVIEPGDKTWTAGAVKYFRYRDQITSFEAYSVKENGKEKTITVQDFIKLETESRTKIISNANAVVSECDVICKLIRGVQETQAGADGYLNAMVSLGMSGFGLSPPPEQKNALNARAAAQAVISATDRSKVDWKKVKVLCDKANKLHKKAVKEWTDYNSKTVNRAEWGAFGATVVSEAAFGTLEVLATGYLVTTKGMNPKHAQIVAATGVEGLKVSAGEIGEYAANDKFDPTKSSMKVYGSMMVTAASNALGTKLSGKAFDKVMGKILPVVGRKFNTRFQQFTFDAVAKIFTSGAGENMIKNAINETGNLIKDVANGKKVDEKLIIEKLSSVLIGTLTGSAQFKSLQKFDKAWMSRSVDLVGLEFQKPIVKGMHLKLVSKFPKGDVAELMSKEGADIVVSAAKKMSETILKSGYAYVGSDLSGTETQESQHINTAMKGLKKDSAFITAMQVAALEEAEKRLEKKQK